MSELSLDNIIPETQEDEECSVTKNNDNKNEEDLSLNESQDFRLVAEDETQNDETIGDNDLIKATENNEHEADAKAVGEEARDSDKDKTTVEQQTKANVDEGESNIDNNADEIIESSQVESSPKHKQLVAGTQKRKATGDSDAEPSLKIPRTSSREDALDAEREKLESATDEKENEKTSEEAKPPASDEPDSKSAQVDDEKVDESSTEVPAEVATDEKMEVDEEVPAEKPAESTESPSKSSEAPSKSSESPSKTSEAPAKSSESPSKSVEPSPTNANLPETSTNSSETAKAVENPSELSKSCAIEDEKMEVDSATTKESTKSSKVIDQTSKKSRMSIEVIYDKALAPPPKPKELVEIDEDGEKIVLDSSQETSFKSPESKSTADNPLTNGSELKSKKANETLGNTPATAETSIDSKTIPTTECINVVSDSENDSSVIEKPKIISIEKEMNVLVKIKCLLQFNETTKEISEKEFLTVDFDNLPDLNISRRRNSDTSGLADISDNKDALSPGSVTSNAQPYTLNPRFSVLSTVSAGSSSSSGSSIVAGGHSASNFPGGSSKLVKDALFSLPRGVPKHAKRMPENLEEVAEKVKKEWKNPNLLTYGILAFVNSEISAADLHNGINEQDTLERLTASTPEAQKKIIATPKSSKKGRVAKRSRPNQRSSRTNGIAKIAQEASIFNDSDPAIIAAEVSTPPRQSSRTLSILRNQTPVDDPSDELIGKICFAKWSDNNYYPGKIVNKSKGKYKVTFMDGKSKMLIQDFILPWDDPPSGLSVFALTKEGYGSPGIITGTKKVKSETVYIVETDEDGKMEVPIKRIFMSSDQAQSLKELDAEKFRNKPSSSEVTMDNIVEGSRASVPTALTTTSTKRTLSSNKFPRSSSSGLAEKKETSANVSSLPDVDTNLQGVQPELIDTPNDFAPKGPASRVKGKGKNRKKSEDTELINTLGPIPKSGSTLFKGMNFILTCAPLESLDRYKMEKRDSLGSEPETENETEWNSIPFVRERLTAQITAGGGQVYNDFEAIPIDEYKNTKLITNVPNITAKSLLCLSAGIYPVNHRWIIRSCQENKLVNVSEEILPTGWSFIKEAYVDTYQRKNSKPLTHAIIALPDKPERSSEFWQQVITNAGGVVRVFSNPPQRFDNVTVVMPLEQEPSTAVIREAKRLDLPLVSTTWLVQSLIEGRMMPCDAHPLYAHNSEKK